MTPKEILSPLIEQEFAKYRQYGHKIRLRTARKQRIKRSVICGILALISFANPALLFIVIPVYIISMLKTRNNVNTIMTVAKQHPATPIPELIAKEMIL